jgi:hypothetical protein
MENVLFLMECFGLKAAPKYAQQLPPITISRNPMRERLVCVAI